MPEVSYLINGPAPNQTCNVAAAEVPLSARILQMHCYTPALEFKRAIEENTFLTIYLKVSAKGEGLLIGFIKLFAAKPVSIFWIHLLFAISYYQLVRGYGIKQNEVNLECGQV